MDNKEAFKFTYSAKEQEEIKAIRKKYAATEETEDKMAQLRRLDMKVSQKAQAVALIIGVIGALLLGIGMSLTMSEFGAVLGAAAMPVGIIVGILGIVLVSLAYPLYNKTVKTEREKIAPLVISLTDELLK